MSNWEYIASPRTTRVSMASNSHLTGRDEMQRPESDLEIGSALLEIVESASDAGLQLRGVLAGRAVRRDLVELRGTHVGGGCRLGEWLIGRGSHGFSLTFFGGAVLEK